MVRYAQYIYQRTQREDLAQVAHDDRLSQDTVRSIFERGATKRLPSGATRRYRCCAWTKSRPTKATATIDW